MKATSRVAVDGARASSARAVCCAPSQDLGKRPAHLDRQSCAGRLDGFELAGACATCAQAARRRSGREDVGRDSRRTLVLPPRVLPVLVPYPDYL